MSNIDIIRAWKDEEYRNSLTEEQRSQLPENPAGMLELSDTQMEKIAGGDPVFKGGSIVVVKGGCTGCVCPGTNQLTCGIVCIPLETLNGCWEL